MIDYIMNFEWNSWIGILLYWVPLGFCAFGYTLRTAQNYMKDKADRDAESGIYIPTDTLGTLIGRAVVTAIPVANLWAAMFDLAPQIFSRLFKILGEIFDQPLVPDTAAASERRKSGNAMPWMKKEG